MPTLNVMHDPRVHPAGGRAALPWSPVTVTITLVKLDARWFPLLCCGLWWADCREYMDHALPSHMTGNDQCVALAARADRN